MLSHCTTEPQCAKMSEAVDGETDRNVVKVSQNFVFYCHILFKLFECISLILSHQITITIFVTAITALYRTALQLLHYQLLHFLIFSAAFRTLYFAHLKHSLLCKAIFSNVYCKSTICYFLLNSG